MQVSREVYVSEIISCNYVRIHITVCSNVRYMTTETNHKKVIVHGKSQNKLARKLREATIYFLDKSH